jgi:hypothetical protein
MKGELERAETTPPAHGMSPDDIARWMDGQRRQAAYAVEQYDAARAKFLTFDIETRSVLDELRADLHRVGTPTRRLR